MGIQQISDASTLLTAADLRPHCSIDATDTTWDGLLTDYIAAATALVQEATGRSLGTQTWKLALDAFPQEITLQRGPVTSVTWIKYYDGTGTEQTLDPALYLVDLISDPARLVPAPDKTWPATQVRANAVTVQFGTGYATVPPTILQAIRATVAAWFQTREAVALPAGVIDALAPWRSQWIFA